jgi:hypothetical protein
MAMGANRSHREKSILGSIIAGHQHSAEPVAVKTSNDVFSLTNFLKCKVTEARLAVINTRKVVLP